VKLTLNAWATITAAGLSINPGDLLSINPGDVLSINPGDVLSINPGDVLSINPGDVLSTNPGDVLSINPGVPAVVLLALASFCGGSLNSTPPYRSTIPSTEG
jgi:DNA-binding Xre family transcriptional regulator